MKVYALAPREDWICDRFVQEWNAFSGIATTTPSDADVVWLLADWCWQQVPVTLLSNKIVVATVHHIVPDKFDEPAMNEFLARHRFVDAYHVPCNKTAEQVKKILDFLGDDTPIFVRPFWMNQGLWYPRSDDQKHDDRLDLGFSDEDFVVGSFQRDTEGSDLKSPKLEKGPDLFCNAVTALHAIHPKVKVLLGGWRRQYVISRLEAANVPYVYVEKPFLPEVNKLYNCLDAYFVASRYEGGPQAILECATIGVPIVSRDVGVASEILHPSCVGDHLVDMICNYEPEYVEHAKKKVHELHLPHGIKPFVDFFDTFERRTKFSRVSPGIGDRKSDV